MTTKAIEACLSEAVKRGAVSKADADAALDELKSLRERVDYLEDAVKDGGADYRAARIGLGVPAFDDDYLALKERAERAEQALADEWDAHKKTRERAEKAEAEADQARDDLAKERVAHEGTRYMLECERHEHGLTKAARDRLRNEPHIIEAGQTKYDAELWRARCQDAEAELTRIRAECAHGRGPYWESEAKHVNEQLQAALQELDRLRGDRAKVTRQRRELRRLNLAQHHYNAGKDRAIYWVGRVATECFRDVVVKRLGDDVHRLVEDAKRAEKAEEKPSAKAEEKPAEDRVVRVGDVWRLDGGSVFYNVTEVREGSAWCSSPVRPFMALNDAGAPISCQWTLVSRKAER